MSASRQMHVHQVMFVTTRLDHTHVNVHFQWKQIVLVRMLTLCCMKGFFSVVRSFFSSFSAVFTYCGDEILMCRPAITNFRSIKKPNFHPKHSKFASTVHIMYFSAQAAVVSGIKRHLQIKQN